MWCSTNHFLSNNSEPPLPIFMEKLSIMDLEDWEYLPSNNFLDDRVENEKVFEEKGVVRPFLDLPPEPSKVPFIDIGVVPSVTKEMDPGSGVEDKESVSRVFFKKMKDNEFADMKVGSPKSSSKGLKLLTEPEGYNKSCEKEVGKKQQKKEWEGDVNIWGWRVTPVGALCCIGVAAATTLCIFVFGSRGGKNQKKNQNIQFFVHSDDKVQKIKQVVQQEHILSQAISAARGVSLDEAQIFFGGY